MADNSAIVAKGKLDAVLKVLPSIHWYAGDACLRETTKGNFDGQAQSHDEFIKLNKAVVDKLFRQPENGEGAPAAIVNLIDPEAPGEYWQFTLVYDKDRWTILKAKKHLGTLVLDLMRADPTMGSMQPYYKKAMDAFAEGKDFRKLFTQPEKK